MAPNSNPSVDPADVGSLVGAIRFAFKKLMQNTDGMLPATVIAVSADRAFATVQPLVMVQGTDGTLLPRPQYARVAVGAYGAGNFVMSFPLAPGDLGWIEASDRDISLYLQNNKAAGPNTNRLHSFSDGVFWSDKARQWTLNDSDASAAVWQSLDGSIKVTLGADKVHIVHPTAILLEAPLIELNAGDQLILHAATKWNWDVNGYGATYLATGGPNYTITTYSIGAVVTAVPAAIDPPGPLP